MIRFAGLSEKEAAEKLRKDGENTLGQTKRKSRIAVFLNQYRDIMTVILLVCTAVSFLMGEYAEAVTILVIVLLNGILGCIQEYRTERTLESLKHLSAPQAKVLRDGKVTAIDAAKVVCGDLLLLSAGDAIAADALLLECAALESDESVLNGESLPAAKIAAPDIPVPDRLNDERLVYAGCSVTRGHGAARVIATGRNTQMGKIAHLLQKTEKAASPLSEKLDRMGKIIAVGCTVVCGVVTLCGVIRGEELLKMLLTGVSLAVAAVPEGLAAIVTISLAVSVARMKERNALVSSLHAVESLGCAGVICTDKTGTLTENRMTVEQVYTPACDVQRVSGLTLTPDINKLLHGAKSCCKDAFAADPTEKALLALADALQKEDRISPICKELPFDSTRKRMSVLVKEDGTTRQYTKGAPDYLLPLCTRMFDGAHTVPMTHAAREKIKRTVEGFGSQALRCICVAYREGNTLCEDDLVFLGLFGLWDPPKKGVKQAIAACKKAGIRVCMVTGDHTATAAKIAKDLGLLRPGDRIMDGKELEETPFALLRQNIDRITVFSRVTPTHKLKIVKAFRENGRICAMTGDGVNDAPALRKADIGVSMGKNGTDVAREASDIILLDYNFTTFVDAVRCGRGVYDNIRKFLRYLLSCNIGEVLTMFLGITLGTPIVLLPLQILLVNLVTDGLPAIALSLEPVEETVMHRPPRPKNESIFSNGLGLRIIFRGILIGVTTLCSFFLGANMSGDLTTARTCALVTLVAAQLIHVFECKSEKGGLFSVHVMNNKALLGAVAVSLAVLFAVVYLPAAATLFGVCALSLPLLGASLLCAAAAPLLCSLLPLIRQDK